MKILSLVSMLCFSILMGSQGFTSDFDYDKAWKEVERAMEKNLPKTALKKVEEIYTHAVNDKNSTQQVKSTLYKTKLVLQTEELGLENVVKDLNTAIDKAKSPTKQILQSYAAEVMQSYFENQYYRLSKRTDLGEVVSDDIRTWSPNNYRAYIHKLYMQSLSNEANKNVKTATLKELIDLNRPEYELRPSLQDLLRDRAIGYYSNAHIGGVQPSFEFILNDEKYLAPADQFVGMDINTLDEESMKYQVLKLYQDALKANKNNTSVFINYDLARLKYVRSDNAIADVDSIYLYTLDQSIVKYGNTASSIEYRIAKAEYYHNHNDKVAAVKEYKQLEKRQLSKRQKRIVDNAIARIQQPMLNVLTEQVYTPKESPTIHIQYKNLDKIYFKLIALDESARDHFYKRGRYLDKYIKDQKVLKTLSVETNSKGEYREEILDTTLDKLPLGSYAVIVSNSNGFNHKRDAYAYAVFHVSDIGYVVQRRDESQLVVVTDRTTGKPLNKAKIDVYDFMYNNVTHQQDRIYRATTYIDKDGKVTLNQTLNKSIGIVVSKGNDKLDLNTSLYANRYREGREQLFTELFTDRAIYRPGQTVHFKLLGMEKSKKGVPHIRPDEKYEVTLYDANHRKVSDLKLKTNEFGTAFGTFTIPKGNLTGQYHLSTEGGNKYFLVEEYKRPTFEVKLDKLTSTPSLGDTVSLTGNATTFSGVFVSDAKVTYTVNRLEYDSWWRYCWGGPANTKQVKIGQTTTDEKGNFSIDFVALTDGDEKENAYYNYEISMDVTHTSGETQSTSESVKIASMPFGYSIDSEGAVDREQLRSVKLSATNSAGESVKAATKLIVTQLILPKQWQKTPYWTDRSDQYYFDDYYQPKKPIDRYKKGKVVFTIELTIDGSYTADLYDKLKGGAYEIRLESMDGSVGSVTRVIVSDMEKGVFPTAELLYVDGVDVKGKVGKQMQFHLGTSEKALTVYYYFLRGNEILEEGVLDLRNKKSLAYTPKKADWGGVTLHLHYGKHNRYFTKTYAIDIPWKDKMLDVQLVTKRDNVLPGSNEEWAIKILDSKGDKAMVELLATMYDASLDAIKEHSYAIGLYPKNYGYIDSRAEGYQTGLNGQLNYDWNRIDYKDVSHVPVPRLKGIDYPGVYGGRVMYATRDASMNGAMMSKRSSAPMRAEMADEAVSQDQVLVTDDKKASVAKKAKKINPRTNLNETVFFYSHLQSDKDGNVMFKFKMNDVLTRWKLLAFAHDKALRYGLMSHEVKTQKDLMIVPNAPRFVREADRIVFPATVTNFTDKPLTVNAKLQLSDPSTGDDVVSDFGKLSSRSITIEASASQRVDWEIRVPKDYKGLLNYTVIAESAGHTDAETGYLPVLTNQKLITESKVIALKEGETKVVDFKFNESMTIIPQLTVEYTSNPVWYAIQALPYIQSGQSTSTLGIFNRFYTNTLASKVAHAHPKIKAILDTWRHKGSKALISNLEKNEELKYAILDETPWVAEAQSETEQKQRIALLFEVNKLSTEKENALAQLRQAQQADGGFSWMPTGRSDAYTTLQIVTGLAQLERLEAISGGECAEIIRRSIEFLDRKMKKRYDVSARKSGLDYLSIQYLYLRSFYPDMSFVSGTKSAYDFYFKKAKSEWTKASLLDQAIIGLVMHRAGENSTSQAIVQSLKERSFYSDELGRYWNYGSAYRWYQMPIGSHARLIELFTEATDDRDFVEDMKIWLIKQKQTNRWSTSKATIDAIYALLIRGESGMTLWINETKLPTVQLDGETITIEDAESGTGYFKKKYTPGQFNDISTISIKNNNPTIGWGAVSYQYFEDLDKVKSYVETPLKLHKKLYKEVATDRGTKLVELNDGAHLTIGDRVIARIELKVDRDMSYVHLKDMRASGFEPENVISTYKYQDGVSYYESTRDLASHFFIDHLTKGTYVFEYPLRAVHKGDFSEGIATIQSMYAPEFTSHSKGVKVEVE